MVHLSVEKLAQITKAHIVSKTQAHFQGVGTDTRKSLKGQLFIPLKGENFDGHDFLLQAVRQGAAVLLTHKAWPHPSTDAQISKPNPAIDTPPTNTIKQNRLQENSPKQNPSQHNSPKQNPSKQNPLTPEQIESLKQKVSILQVKDTLQALHQLAHYWRQQLKAPVVGITGSVGKTSTKHFAAQILSQKYKSFASPQSFNNHWGVPLSILQVPHDTEVVILELGMSAAGEITTLCNIAQPDIVMVTTVAPAHMINFKSLNEVAQAKAEIYAACPKAQKIFNLDNPRTLKMYKKFAHNQNQLVFSKYHTTQHISSSDVQMAARQIDLNTLQIEGRIGMQQGQVQLRIFGPHHVYNLMGAACVARLVGMSEKQIWQALPQCQLTWGRGQVEEFRTGGQVVRTVFDAYNANPCSMQAFIEALSFDQGVKFFVLGEMLELGDSAATEHKKLGQLLRQVPQLGGVFFMGPSYRSVEQGLLGLQNTEANQQRGTKFRVDNDATLYVGAHSGVTVGFTGVAEFYPHYDDKTVEKVAHKVAHCIQKRMGQGEALLAFKASRGVRLERVLKVLKKDLNKNDE